MMTEINKITEVENHIDGLKAIIFDLDDTLYGEKEYVRSGYRAIAKFLGDERIEDNLWDAFWKKEPAIDAVLKDEGIYTDELKQKCLKVYREHQPDIHFYDGVVEMLRGMRTEGYKLGIITDGRPEGQRAKIKSLGLEGLVDKIIITDELGGTEYRKPCERAFVLMKEYFGVQYIQMCYVGDNARKDFVAPKKLGMRSIWVRNVDGLYFEQ